MNKKEVSQKVETAQKEIEKEMAKLKKQMEAAAKKAEIYIKKNPEKAAIISAGVGAALGAAAALLMGQAPDKGKKK